MNKRFKFLVFSALFSFAMSTYVVQANDLDAEQPQTFKTEWVAPPGIEGGSIQIEWETGTIIDADNIKIANIPAQINGIQIKAIGEEAFANCDDLIQLTLPNTITFIDDYAFFECSKLTSVNIPSSVLSIGNGAFQNSDMLTNVDIPNSVISIGEEAFFSCDNLATVNIFEGVQFIGTSAFAECDSLKNVTLSEGLQTIGDYAFYKCDSLTEINIPSTVTSIGDKAFSEIDNMTKVILSSSNISFGDRTFRWSDVNTLIISDGVTAVDTGPFYNVTTITIPKTITSIKLENLSNLETVYFGGNINDWNKIRNNLETSVPKQVKVIFDSVVPPIASGLTENLD
ncbi:hypothetical protein AN641_09780 [Candidatus Epulonipiscioides gigas]|nr:hypothetical protein AN641_09780 [Epulopiscium sp. SCG-C07WGA-EpuloA2]